MVSALGDHYYEFPEPKTLKLRLKDLLEDKVDEKYYISDKALMGTILSRDYKDPKLVIEPKCEQVGMLSGGKWDKMHDISRRVYSGNGLSPTLHTCGGGNLEPKIAEVVDEPLAYDEQNRYIRQYGTVGTLTTDGSSPKHNNRVIEPIQNDVLVWDGYNQQVRADQSCIGTLTRQCGADLKRNGQGIIEPCIIDDTYAGRDKRCYSEYAPAIRAEREGFKVLEQIITPSCRIRKLTPKECFRLMGVKDEDFERVAKNQSNSSLYHLAGDSIVTNCLMEIFKEML